MRKHVIITPGGFYPSGLLTLISFQEMEKRGQQCDQRRHELENFSCDLGLKLSASFLFSHVPHLLYVIYYTPTWCICQYLEMLNRVKPGEISAFFCVLRCNERVQQRGGGATKQRETCLCGWASARFRCNKATKPSGSVAPFRCTPILCIPHKIKPKFRAFLGFI